MNSWSSSTALLFVITVPVLCSSSALGQSAQFPRSPASSLTAEQQKRTFGGPQVIEIPLPEAPVAPPPPAGQDDFTEQPSQGDMPTPLSRPTPSSRPGYLGVLYATAEEGPAGVRVVDVVPGSPAERSGFSAMPLAPTGTAQLLKVAIILLALSPAGPLAIPLAIAHDAHYNQPSQGDLIVAVEGQPVRDAQEFNDAMRRFQPGDTVTFLVQRGDTRVPLSAQLEAEPQ